MAQFRVEFVVDQATGKYLVELHDPENPSALIARTEAMYATQAAAVMGVIDLFKNALLQFPKPPVVRKQGKPKKKAAPRPKKAKAKKASKRRKRK